MKYLIFFALVTFSVHAEASDSLNSERQNAPEIECSARPAGNDESFFPITDLESARIEGERIIVQDSDTDGAPSGQNENSDTEELERQAVMKDVAIMLSQSIRFPSCEVAGGIADLLWYYPVSASCAAQTDLANPSSVSDEDVYNATRIKLAEAIAFLHEKCSEEDQAHAAHTVFFRTSMSSGRTAESFSDGRRYEDQTTTVACCISRAVATISPTPTHAASPVASMSPQATIIQNYVASPIATAYPVPSAISSPR